MGILAFIEKGIPPIYLHRIKGKDSLAESSQIITNYEFHISSSGGWRALRTPPVQQCAVITIFFFKTFKKNLTDSRNKLRYDTYRTVFI